MAKQKKEFYTIDEIASELGINRTSVYPYLNLLKIERHKIPLHRKRGILPEDFEKIKQYRTTLQKVD